MYVVLLQVSSNIDGMHREKVKRKRISSKIIKLFYSERKYLCTIAVIGPDGQVRSFMELAGAALRFHKTGNIPFLDH